MQASPPNFFAVTVERLSLLTRGRGVYVGRDRAVPAGAVPARHVVGADSAPCAAATFREATVASAELRKLAVGCTQPVLAAKTLLSRCCRVTSELPRLSVRLRHPVVSASATVRRRYHRVELGDVTVRGWAPCAPAEDQGSSSNTPRVLSVRG